MKKQKDRMSKSFVLVVLFFLGVYTFSASAQVSTITGIITSENGSPLPGVNVIQKGTTNGVVTDFDGNYSLNITNGSRVLVFSYLGFKTQEVSVAGKSKVNVALVEDNEQLDEVVVIGYGTANKRDVLGSVGSVKADELIEAAPVDALSAIQGRMAGVQILTNSGPGNSSEIVIRGISTLTSGGVGPLYVVDGQQMDDIDNINPNDIASMDILKDGASAAIYGSKSANGVVLITTKKGKSGFPKIDVSVQNSISFLSNKVPISNTVQRNKFISLRTAGSTNDSGVVEDSLSIKSQLVVDIQELIKRVAVKNQVNVGFSGGSETAKFYWNTGFLKEQGIIVGSSFKRINTNLNIDFDLNKNIKAGTRLTGTYEFQEGLFEGTVFRELSYRQTDVLIYDFDGSYIRERYARANPVARAIEADNDNRNFRGSSFNYMEFKIIPDLTFKTTLGVNFRLQKLNQFRPSSTTGVDDVNRIYGNEVQRLSYDIQNENYFSYNKKFKGGHSFTAMAGMSIQQWNQEYSKINAISYNNDYIRTLNNASVIDQVGTKTTNESNALSSVFGRLSYDYNRKYLLSGTFRRDGSSKFGANKLWGDFPSVSAGWRISNENFMKSFDFLSELKLRGSYAITGNERIDLYRNIPIYDPGYYYNGVNGFALSQLGNPDLSWESTTQTNYGVDLALFKRRLTISVDRYIKTTTDLLYEVPIPRETGFSTILSNIGSVENRGYDIEVKGTPLTTKDFKWFSSFNISFNKNKVLDLNDDDGFETGGYFVEEGESIGNMYGYKNLGVYRYNESNAYADNGLRLKPNFDENDNFVNYTLNGQPYSGNINQLKFGVRTLGGGDIIWEDQNGDFVIDPENDRTTIGNGLAKFIGGWRNTFDYKNFSVSCLLNFNFGNDIYRGYDHTRDKASNSVYTPGPFRIDGAWVNPGDITKYPSLDGSRPQNRTGYDSNYVSQGDYIKLKNIRLGYNFDKEALNRLKFIDGLSLSLIINDLLTFTNYEGYNPELGWQGNPLQPGWDNLRYPNKTDIIMSLNVQF